MRVEKAGHRYKLKRLDGEGHEVLQFVDRNHGTDTAGTTNQEVIRVLVDRIEFLDTELTWAGNKEIIKHLRMALVLHEARHITRLVERGLLKPEYVKTGVDGHFVIEEEEF